MSKLPKRETIFVGDITRAINLKAMGKPRQTRSDKWNQRPVVVNFRKTADALREAFDLKPMEKFHSCRSVHVTVYFDRTYERNKPTSADHTKKPDVDNVLKGIMDSLIENDHLVQVAECKKSWLDADLVFITLGGVVKYV